MFSVYISSASVECDFELTSCGFYPSCQFSLTHHGNKTNKYEYTGTMDQEMPDAAAYAPGKCCVYSPDSSTFVREMTSWPPS